jgi:O-antigen/teichoic acid export membrane protein
MIVRILMGPEFAPAVAVLRIEAAYPILVSVACSLGMQWLVPLGYDRLVLRITLTAGILNTALATLLAPHFAHVGMAWGVVATESFVFVSFLLTVAKTCPLWGKRIAPVQAQPQGCENAQVGTVSAGSFPAGETPGIQVRGLN